MEFPPRLRMKKAKPRDIVLALLYLLCSDKKRCTMISEKFIQKLTFLALYTYEDGGKLYFESERLRKIIDDYRVAWYGVYSGKLRDALRELESEKLIEYEAESLYRITQKGMREGERAYHNLDEEIRKKLEWAVAEFGDKQTEELEQLTNSVIGLSGEPEDVAAGKGLMLGTYINDMIEFAKAVKRALDGL